MAWSTGAGSVTVTVTPNVSAPTFLLGATSTRCNAAQTVTYTATAANSTGITYSLDAASIAGGNTIDPQQEQSHTRQHGWDHQQLPPAAAGCAGPTTATHTVTTNPSVGTPVFTLGATSTRCQANGNVSYTATATNSTGITYSLDAASIAGGNSINACDWSARLFSDLEWHYCHYCLREPVVMGLKLQLIQLR